MNKRNRICISLLLLVSILAGCVKSDISSENDKYDIMAEYVAGILIDNSYGERERYYALVEVKKGEEPTSEEKSTQSEEESKEAESNIWKSFFGLDECTVEYVSAYVGKEFDYGLLYTGARNENEKLVVFTFKLTNDSNHDLIFNNKNKDVRDIYYELVISGLSYRIFTSGFYNEFISLDKRVLAPGETLETFLMFSVPDDVTFEKFMLMSPNGSSREMIYKPMGL